jgi:DNA replication protein DnaC
MSTKELIDKQMAEFAAKLDAMPDAEQNPTATVYDAYGLPMAQVVANREPTPLDGFPTRYRDQGSPTGERWLAEYAKAKAMTEAGGIVMFYGLRGTGKSRMAYEVAKNANLPKRMFPASTRTSFTKTRPAIYRSAMRIFIDLRDTYRRDSETSEKELMDAYAGAALLVIDEAQERGETDFENRKLTAIVDARYADARPTIIIGNYTRQQFAENLSDSIIDRVRENGGGINFDWESYRKTTNQ